MLFLTLILYSAYRQCTPYKYLNRKWNLADGRILIVYNWREYCHHRFGTAAYISDGTKEYTFDKTSGTIKLADGRTAYVGQDDYLRVVSDKVEKIETIKLFSYNDTW